MKAKLLSGLTALLLGGLTSCSNILEENGVINNVAESGMGELRINLSTDVSLNVSTKAEGSEETSEPNAITSKVMGLLNETNADEFTITGKGSVSSNILNGTVESYKSGKVVPVDTYSITAENSYDSNTRIATGRPHFKGEVTGVKVQATQETVVNEFKVTLQNSVITVNPTSITEFLSDTKNSITEIYVQDPTDTFKKYYFTLNDENTGLKEPTSVNELLFVDPSVEKVSIVMKGRIDGIGEFTAPHDITTKELHAKNFLVSYKISIDNGTLKFTVSVDGSVDEQKETVTIYPYDQNTNTQQQ